jgi:hypothetical protein
MRSIYAEYGRTLTIRPLKGEDTDELFDRVCSEFENTRIEQDAQGSVFIKAPNGGESSHREPPDRCPVGDVDAPRRKWSGI